MITETNWLASRIETATDHRVIDLFVVTINPLSIRPNMVNGNVLVGGCGGGFPERVMLCSPDSDFSLIEPRVNSLTCADPDFFTDPSLVLENPVEKKFSGQKPNLKRGKITYYPASLQTILPAIGRSVFDTVLFFRIQRLQEQLTTGLNDKLQRVIKSGGYLLGSGSFNSLQACQEIFQQEFNIEQIISLMNPDYSGYAYHQHVGFVLRKK